MDFAYWLQIGLILAPMVALMGVTFEKVRQIEKRLNGDGDSVPGRCRLHAHRLDALESRHSPDSHE